MILKVESFVKKNLIIGAILRVVLRNKRFRRIMKNKRFFAKNKK